MEFIGTNNKYEELGYLHDAVIDIDIGAYNVSQNDFEIIVPIENREPDFKEGSLFYCENSEYGGVVERMKVDTGGKKITFTGLTFRGLLTKEYVQPPDGQAYLELKGNAKNCLEKLIGDSFSGLYVVDHTDVIVNYQVRDLNLLQAIEKTLKTGNAKLGIQIIEGVVHLQVLPIQDLSELIQYDNDYDLSMVVETKGYPYNHILALGKGELTQRLRINLYLQDDGSWAETPIVGLKRKTYKYENTNDDTIEALKKDALERIKDTTKTDSLKITFNAENADLFDIVGAKECITGISFKQPITQKILKYSNGNTKITYKVGDKK